MPESPRTHAAAIDPMPPHPRGLPWLGSGIDLLRNPTDFFARTRQRLGDTFSFEAFGYRLFCVFSAQGVKALYALPEEQASFGLATYTLVFKHKLPLELVMGRRNRPHDLFGSQEVERYLDVLERAVGVELDQLGAGGAGGRFEAFEWARRVGHRLGLAAWAGPEAASEPCFGRLIPLFERLDSAASFVQPAQAFRTLALRKRAERRAMRGIEEVIGGILEKRERAGAQRDDYLEQINASFADLPTRERRVEVARDVILLHLGAMSNLYAALAWTLIDLLLRPHYLKPVSEGDDALLEQCANESIRIAQRSITLRQVMKPIEIEDEKTRYLLQPGVMIATMLSVNNTSAADGLELYDPTRWQGRRLASAAELPSRELVSTFGHGRHSCPAQRFSISAIRIALRRLLERFELEAEFADAQPQPRQIGAVARAAAPCPVRYRPRS